MRTVPRFAPSEQWKQAPIQVLKALPWKPKTDGDLSTDFILLPSSKILPFGKIRAPPGLEPPAPAASEEPVASPPALPGEILDDDLATRDRTDDIDCDEYVLSLPGDDDDDDDRSGAQLMDPDGNLRRLKNVSDVFGHPVRSN